MYYSLHWYVFCYIMPVISNTWGEISVRRVLKPKNFTPFFWIKEKSEVLWIH